MKIEQGATECLFRMICIAIFSLILLNLPSINAQATAADTVQQAASTDSPKVDLMFVLDNSGSMIRNDPQFITREVVTNYLHDIKKNFRVGMVVFDQDARLLEPLSAVENLEARDTILSKLGSLNYQGQFTNTPAGVERAIYELKTDGREDAKKVIVLLTDGIVDTGNKDQDLEGEKWLKDDLAMECKKAGIRIFGVAFTDNADFRMIQSLAIQTDGEYFRAYTADDIQSIFHKIDEIIFKPIEPVAAESVPPEEPEPLAAEKPVPVEPSDAPPEAQPLEKKEALPLSLLLVGLIIIVIIFACLVFMRRKKDVIIRADALKSVGSGHAAEERPTTPAELIDAENIISDTSLSLSLPLDKRIVRIGRDASNEIVIPQRSVSSFHATIEYKNGYYYLEDHRSTNGTKLNNELIRENTPIRLKSGDTIHFADCEFRFLVPDMAPYGETVMIKRDTLK